jgi:lipoprotein-releasing system permease protein
MVSRGRWIVGTNAHVIVREDDGIADFDEAARKIGSLPHVAAVAPFVFFKAMVMSATGTDALFVKGIDLERERSVTSVPSYVKPADFSLEGAGAGLGRIVIGKEMAYGLKVAVGDTLLLARGEVSAGSLYGIAPEFKRFVVAGFFDSGMYEYDASLGFVSLADAQDFLRLGTRVTGISVRLDDMYKAPMVREGVALMLGGEGTVTDWMLMNRTLFSWMRTEKQVMFIILTLIIVVAAFNIAGTLIMIVMERTKDIGIMRSMGATSGAVMRIFMLQGLIIGSIGTVLGTVGGVVLSVVVDRYNLIQLPGDVYFISSVPVRLEVPDIAAVALVALAICFATTFYPAWRAARLAPVEAIGYE